MNDNIVRSAQELEALLAEGYTIRDIPGPKQVIELGPDDDMEIILTNPTRRDIFVEIELERDRQDEKWGPVPRLRHDFGKWLKILMEEIGEASTAELEVDFYEGEIQPEFIQEVDNELTQAAAVIVAWLEHRTGLRVEMNLLATNKNVDAVRREWEALAK